MLLLLYLFDFVGNDLFLYNVYYCITISVVSCVVLSVINIYVLFVLLFRSSLFISSWLIIFGSVMLYDYYLFESYCVIFCSQLLDRCHKLLVLSVLSMCFCHDFAILFVMFDLLGYDQLPNFQQCQLTVDGFEILHHQKDAWNPIDHGINQLAQDFLTIHRKLTDSSWWFGTFFYFSIYWE